MTDRDHWAAWTPAAPAPGAPAAPTSPTPGPAPTAPTAPTAWPGPAPRPAPTPAARREPAAPVGLWVAVVAGVAGAAVLIAGTFLPWVASGAVTRNLYTVAGTAQRLGLLGSGGAVTRWLPLLGPLCILPLVLAVLRLRRTAAVVGIAVAIVAGGAAVAALVLASGRSVVGVSLDATGPGTVVAGAVLLLTGSVTLLFAGRPATVGTSEVPGLPESGTGSPAHPSH